MDAELNVSTDHLGLVLETAAQHLKFPSQPVATSGTTMTISKSG
jgi:hypothetical protein